MKIKANSISEYLENIPTERKAVMQALISTINNNLPKGFAEQLNYGMPSWVVPHSLYPCLTKEFYCRLSYGDLCKP